MYTELKQNKHRGELSTLPKSICFKQKTLHLLLYFRIDLNKYFVFLKSNCFPFLSKKLLYTFDCCETSNSICVKRKQIAFNT